MKHLKLKPTLYYATEHLQKPAQRLHRASVGTSTCSIN